MTQTSYDSGASHGSLKSYTVGFLLSIALTVVAFGVAMSGTLPRPAIFIIILAAAVAQILVHLHYFLHLDTSSAERWNLLAFLFTVMIMIIFIGGSIWIMYNLNYRMMH